jgi:hypothetical protein
MTVVYFTLLHDHVDIRHHPTHLQVKKRAGGIESIIIGLRTCHHQWITEEEAQTLLDTWAAEENALGEVAPTGELIVHIPLQVADIKRDYLARQGLT